MLLLPLSIRGFSTKSLPTIHRILVPIASGSEEIETTCITDVLTRFGAEGETLLRTKPKQRGTNAKTTTSLQQQQCLVAARNAHPSKILTSWRFNRSVTVASVTSKTVKMSRGLNIEADCLITSLPFPASSYSAIVLPGGVPGVNHLADCETLKSLLLEHHEQKGLIGEREGVSTNKTNKTRNPDFCSNYPLCFF